MFLQTRPSSQKFAIVAVVGVAMLVAGVAFALPGGGSAPPEAAPPMTHQEGEPLSLGVPDPEPPPVIPSPATPPDTRADQIRALLAGRPLADYADEMVAASDRHGIDWRYLPILSFLESGGGVAACGGNAWGYAACDVRFADYLSGMDTVAATLARYPYAGKSVATVLCIWQSGGGCSTEPAIAYAYLGAPYFDLLGDPIGLPAQLASQPLPPTVTPTATPTSDAPVSPSPSASVTTPAGTPTPAAPSPTQTAAGNDNAGPSGAGTPDSTGTGAG